MENLSSKILYDITLKIVNQNTHNNISLFHGYSGDLLLIYELYNVFHHDSLLNYRDKLLEKINHNVNECKSFNFRDGFSGLLYAYAYLDNNNFIKPSIDLFDEFDEYFVDHINILSQIKDYELLHGLIGFGIYYIERAKKQAGKNKYVYKIIDSIIGISQMLKEYRYWENTSEIHPMANGKDKWISFSFLHGMPSIVSFLTICIREGYGSCEINKLINESLDIFNMIRDIDATAYYSDYSLILNRDTPTIHYDKRCHLFYCNGEVGYINMYYKLAEILKDSQMYKESELIYKKIKPDFLLLNNLSSYCVCHGKAGLLYFINTFEQYFNEDLSTIKNELTTDILNYLNNSIKSNSGILEGHTGIILSLLSLLKKNCLGRLLLLE